MTQDEAVQFVRAYAERGPSGSPYTSDADYVLQGIAILVLELHERLMPDELRR